MGIEDGDVTQLLKAMHKGDPKAAEMLLPLLYAELHRLAKAYMRRERPEHTLQPTALINEAYLRLIGDQVDWNSRSHFIGIAAQVMRRVLVDHARAHKADRRAGKLKRVELQDDLALSAEQLDEVTALDEALVRLATVNQRQARVVDESPIREAGLVACENVALPGTTG